jgi:RNA polymerase sigma-70 factor, ECF subfamily
MSELPQHSSILKRVALGDASAVGECIQSYGSLILTLSLRFLGHRADAEDATQEIFLDLWKSASRYDDQKSSEPTFVVMIARRRLVDYKRRQPRLTIQDDFDMANQTSQSHQSTPHYDQSDEANQIRSAMNELDQSQRTALLMSIQDGLTHAEIAVKMNTPLGTVKSWIKRGLETVRGSCLQQAKLGTARTPQEKLQTGGA